MTRSGLHGIKFDGFVRLAAAAGVLVVVHLWIWRSRCLESQIWCSVPFPREPRRRRGAARRSCRRGGAAHRGPRRHGGAIRLHAQGRCTNVSSMHLADVIIKHLVDLHLAGVVVNLSSSCTSHRSAPRRRVCHHHAEANGIHGVAMEHGVAMDAVGALHNVLKKREWILYTCVVMNVLSWPSSSTSRFVCSLHLIAMCIILSNLNVLWEKL